MVQSRGSSRFKLKLFDPKTAEDVDGYKYDEEACQKEYEEITEVTQNIILLDIDEKHPYIQQLFWRAFQLAELPYVPCLPEIEYQNYPWHQQFPRISEFSWEIHTTEGEVLNLKQGSEKFGKSSSQEVEGIAVKAILEAQDSCEEITLETDLLILDGTIFLTKENALDVETLLEILERCFFVAVDEFNEGVDSKETQKKRFRESWKFPVMEILLSKEEMIYQEIKERLQPLLQRFPDDLYLNVELEPKRMWIKKVNPGEPIF